MIIPVVGNIKTRTLKNYRNRRENTLGITAALGTGNGTIFAEAT